MFDIDLATNEVQSRYLSTIKCLEWSLDQGQFSAS